jgi:hypothetical protein
MTRPAKGGWKSSISAGAACHCLKHITTLDLVTEDTFVQRSVFFVIRRVQVQKAGFETFLARVASVVEPDLRAGLGEAEVSDAFTSCLFAIRNGLQSTFPHRRRQVWVLHIDREVLER